MNDHIIEYLTYYIGLKDAPNYAILIDGEWGSGKTHLINKFIESEKDYKFIRISLYGVSSIADIENSFFIALHPVLGSKPARVASTILKGILKTAIKVDLDNNGKEDITIDYKIPDNAKWLTDLDKHVIVIDDLERSTLSINVVLGYLNELVESSGQKVIIIANEKEIELVKGGEIESLENNDQSEKRIIKNSYSQIKEKLIGKSFTVKSDFENAFENFTFALINEGAKRMLRNNEFYISKIFVESSYNNLRILNQTIIDFDRFYTFLPNIPEVKKELIEHIILLFFTISIEIRKGAITEDEITVIYSSIFESKSIFNKYSNYATLYTHPISDDLLLQYFKNGTMSAQTMEKEINGSSYYYDENTAAWQQLQNYYSMDDKKFDRLLNEVKTRFETETIQDPDELYGCVPLLIVLNYKGLSKLSMPYLIKLYKSNFYRLIKNGCLAKSLDEGYSKSVNHTMHYRVKDYPEIGDFYNFVLIETEKHRAKINSNIGNEILDNMESLDFFEKSVVTYALGTYTININPLLHYINVNTFCMKFILLSNREKIKLAGILKQRYQHKMYRDYLKIEQVWLRKLQNLFSKTKKPGSVSGLIYRDLVRFIGEILDNFERDKLS